MGLRVGGCHLGVTDMDTYMALELGMSTIAISTTAMNSLSILILTVAFIVHIKTHR